MPNTQLSLYQKVVAISEEYLGPAGERFIRRQIKLHLDMDPEKLTAKHLEQLARWVSLTFAVLTNNPREVDEFTQKLKLLSESNNK